MRTVALLLVAAWGAIAQVPSLYLDISGPWRFQIGDNLEYAKPTFDDHSWRTMLLPREGVQPLGWSWLRRDVDLPAWADSSQMVLTVGGMNEVYEVYVNGQRIGSAGGPRLSRTFVARPRTFGIPSLQLSANERRVTVALRLWNSGYISSAVRGVSRYPDTGPYLLTYRANAPHHVAAASMASRERESEAKLITGEFQAVLGILLLLGWFVQRTRRDLAYFAGNLLSEALLTIYDYLSIVADWPHITNNIGAMGLTLSPLFLAYFAATSLGGSSAWLRAAAWLPFALQATDNLLIWLKDDLSGSLRSFQLSMSAVLALRLCVAVFTLYRVRHDIRTALQGHFRRSLIIPATILILLVLQGQRSLSSIFTLSTHGMTLSLYQLANVLVGVGMTIHLIRSLGAARQRLDDELQAARIVQQLLLGEKTAPTAGYDIEAEYRPAQEVGGDFYQVLALENDGKMLVIGDVSGKGLRAAMVVAMTIGILRTDRELHPSRLLAKLNRALVGTLDGGFVTCFIARLEPNGEVVAANAGHLSPYVNGAERDIAAGVPLGLIAEAEYDSIAIRLVAGDALVVVSDGVAEAANTRRELFGFDRTRDISVQTATEIAAAAKAWGQNDDITVVTVRRTAA